MKNIKIVEKFGELLMKQVRDEVCDINERILKGGFGGIEDQNFFQKTCGMSIDEKELILSFAKKTLDSTIHYFLWMFEQEESFDIIYKDPSGQTVSLKEMSDGLYGEPYGEDGWIKKFSKYSPSVN